MHPVLFKVGSFELRTYGVMLVIGVLVAVHLARKRAPNHGISPQSIWDSVFWLVIPGIIGARITYIAQFWDHYRAHPEQLWSLRFEGLTSFGGLIGGFIGFLVWRARTKVPLWGFLDTVGVPILVAQAIGRVGCLLNGCCYGRPTAAWYGVAFQGLPDKHVPAQLVDTALMLVGAVVLTMIERSRHLRPGVPFGLFLIAYGVSRFVYEAFRAGTKAEFAQGIASSSYLGNLPITGAQATCFAFFALGAWVILAARKRAVPDPAPVPSA